MSHSTAGTRDRCCHKVTSIVGSKSNQSSLRASDSLELSSNSDWSSTSSSEPGSGKAFVVPASRCTSWNVDGHKEALIVVFRYWTTT